MTSDASYDKSHETQLEAFLLHERKGKYRQGQGNEQWIDHFCLFHDDGNHRGASTQIETHAYKCRHGGEYTWEDVLGKAGILHRLGYGPSNDDPADQRMKGERAGAALLQGIAPTQAPAVESPSEDETHARIVPGQGQAAVAVVDKPVESGENSDPLKLPTRMRYTYLFPESGDVSHYIERVDFDDHKDFYWVHPDGVTKGKPEDAHPIYGDHDIEERSYVIIVEGEKCVDAINSMHDALDQPIRGITWANGSGSADKFSVALAHRIAELNPKLVIVWPDNDIAGGQAMTKITNALKQKGIEYSRVKPREYGWPPKYDAADYVADNLSLAKIVDDAVTSLPTAGVGAFVDKIFVTKNEHMAFAGTRTLWPMRPEYIDSMWQKEFGTLPRQSQVRDALSKLRQKTMDAPTEMQYRHLAEEDGFYWRPSPVGNCWHVTKEGTEMVPDPPFSMIVVHQGIEVYPSATDPMGKRGDFINWCEMFHLTPLDVAIVEGWLICCLTGLQTPILMMRGQAGSGKTTFARSLISIIEPIVFEIDAGQERKFDNRAFLQQLVIAPALLMDNVSSLTYPQEDILSKLVTGFTTTMRTLYTSNLEILNLQKGVVITTVNYDVAKSDLSSRMVVASPSLGESNRWKPNRYIMEALAQKIPKVRGYIFSRCQEFYANRDAVRGEAEMFRVGDLGWVLRALGYPADEIARAESVQKSEVINQNDLTLDAIVEWWEGVAKSGAKWHKISATKLCTEIGQRMRVAGAEVEELPKPSKKFSRYMEEKRQILKDFGIDVERIREADFRGYHFQRLDYEPRDAHPTVATEESFDDSWNE